MFHLHTIPRFGFSVVVFLMALTLSADQIFADTIQRDALVTGWLQRVVTPSNLCSAQALSALAISQEQCVLRVQRVHKECSTQITSSLPDHLSPDEVAVLYAQISTCYSQVMSENFH